MKDITSREIELKAHVSSWSFVKSRLDSFAQFLGYELKRDEYFRLPDGPAIRIREERLEEKVRELVTYKKKELRHDGIEANEEMESEMVDTNVLRQYLLDSGHCLYLKKEKKGYLYCYTKNGICANIDLCEVGQLGWFVEIEVQGTDEDAATRFLLEVLKLCAVDKSAIEPLYYSQLLGVSYV